MASTSESVPIALRVGRERFGEFDAPRNDEPNVSLPKPPIRDKSSDRVLTIGYVSMLDSATVFPYENTVKEYYLQNQTKPLLIDMIKVNTRKRALTTDELSVYPQWTLEGDNVIKTELRIDAHTSKPTKAWREFVAGAISRYAFARTDWALSSRYASFDGLGSRNASLDHIIYVDPVLLEKLELSVQQLRVLMNPSLTDAYLVLKLEPDRKNFPDQLISQRRMKKSYLNLDNTRFMSWSRAFVRIAHNTNERVVPIEDLEAMSSVFKRYLVSDKRIQDWRNQNAQKDMQEFLQRDVVRKMIDTVDEAKFLSDGQKQELQTLLKQMIQTPAEETKNALANFLDSIVFEERAKPEEEFMKLQQTKVSLEVSSDAKSTEAKQLKDQINIYDQQFEKLEEWNGKKQELSIDIEQLTVLMAFKSEEIDRTNEKTESVQKRLEEKLQPFEQRIATTNASIEQLELEKEEYLSEFDTVECPATNSSISSFDKQLEALQMQNQKLQTTIPELKTLASGLNRFFASGIRRMFTTVTEIDNNVLLTTLETQFGYPSSVAILDLVYRFATSVVQLENKLEDNSPLLVVQALFNYLNTYYDTGMKNTRQEHLAAFDRLYSDLRVLLDDETIIPDLGTIIEMFFEEITSRYELYLAVMFDRETSIDEKSMAKTALATVENAIQQNNAEIQELYQQRYEFVRIDAVWDKVEKAKKEWKGTTLQALEDEKKRNERDLENVLRILDIAKRQRDRKSINREEREILKKTKKTEGSLRTTPLTTKEVIKKLQGDVAFAEQKLANTQKKINNFDRPGGQLAVARKKYVCLLKNYDPLLFSFEEQAAALREQIVQTETEITQDQTIQAFEQEIATLNEKAKRLENELEEHNVELQKKQAGLDTLDEPDEPDVTAEELEQLKDQLLTLLEQATNLSVEADRVGQELDVIRRQLEQIDAQDQVVISVKRDIQKLYQTLLQEQQPGDKDETLVTFLTTYSPAEAAPVFDLAQNWLITLINDQVDQNEYGQYFAPTRTSQAIQEFKKYPRVRTDARSKLNKWQRKRLGFEPKTQ